MVGWGRRGNPPFGASPEREGGCAGRSTCSPFISPVCASSEAGCLGLSQVTRGEGGAVNEGTYGRCSLVVCLVLNFLSYNSPTWTTINPIPPPPPFPSPSLPGDESYVQAKIMAKDMPAVPAGPWGGVAQMPLTELTGRCCILTPSNQGSIRRLKPPSGGGGVSLDPPHLIRRGVAGPPPSPPAIPISEMKNAPKVKKNFQKTDETGICISSVNFSKNYSKLFWMHFCFVDENLFTISFHL